MRALAIVRALGVVRIRGAVRALSAMSALGAQECGPAGSGRMRGRASGLRSDEGSAVAEFTLVSALLALVFVSVLQLGLVLHVRNTVVDSAIAGARMAAAADRTTSDGEAHTALLIRAAVGEAYARDIRAVEAPTAAGDIVTVTVRTPVPLFGLFIPVGDWELSGRALAEDPQL